MSTRKNAARTLSIAALSLCFIHPTIASPLLADFFPLTGQCDDPPPVRLSDELGSGPFFQPLTDEWITVQTTPFFPVNACVADDGIANDWVVSMTNQGNLHIADIFFVADDGITVGNADGIVNDVPFANLSLDAFRIDGTVTLGQNDPLLGDANFDEIFSPGETWEFFVVNFDEPNQLPPRFGSIGLSGLSFNDPDSNASIIATIVPEPAGPGVFIGYLLGLLACIRRSYR